jgi:peptidoglycan/LPS O-acetylase OafA/YrhL
LIGRILLIEKRLDKPLKSKLIVFYMRRSLRIFPLYYFVLTCFAIASPFAIQLLPHRCLLACALYIYNWYFIHLPVLAPLLGHFWTLAIEEQFYLLVPLIVLTLSSRALLRGFAIYMLAAVGLEFLALPHHRWNTFIFFNSFSNFAFLGLGIYLALADEGHGSRFFSPTVIRYVGIGCAGLLAGFSVLYWRSPFTIVPWHRYAVAGFSAWIIWDCWHQRLPALQKLLEARPLVQLGRISYGLYVYHEPILYLLTHRLHNKIAIAASLLLTVAMSILSWYLLERPALELKKRFQY